MKKTVALLLAVVLTLGLCACGGAAQTPAEQPAEEDTTESETSTEKTSSKLAPEVDSSSEESLTPATESEVEPSSAVSVKPEPTPEATPTPTPTPEPTLTPEPDPDPVMVEFPDQGFRYQFPMEYLKAKGLLRWVINDKYDYMLDLYYIFATKDMIDASSLKEEIESNYVISFDTRDRWCEELDTDYERLNSLLIHEYDSAFNNPDIMYEIQPDRSVVGRKGNTFYDIDYYSGEAMVGIFYGGGMQIQLRNEETPEYKLKMEYGDDPLKKDMIEEYVSLGMDDETFVSGFLPLEGGTPFTYVPIGSKLTPEEKANLNPVVFETTDLDGNPVSSTDLFADYKVNLIFIWSIGYDYNDKDLPLMEELKEAYKDQNCQIIGICDDITLSTAAKAKKILSDCGVTCTILIPPSNMEELFGQFDGDSYTKGHSRGESYYVDSEGNYMVRYESSFSRAAHGLDAALEEAENNP